ncbi:putative bifunctional diguanylate cyclase/phosphodiesterase [Aestuariispira insulae]|uniref:Diguanylate cyclase (GGDEF)-like protein n=1 Tax=Aestuariispira insulae TaxID=1461337 RepID=A0A3D9HJQ7_9PROT|nr:bifunctional diguanylate cyclase/phosphodiesterase [Aestuariispira insulae]RED49156.1 diguanylate cyclase (GGDEF)-like protein [Aestuariispira insulae]
MGCTPLSENADLTSATASGATDAADRDWKTARRKPAAISCLEFLDSMRQAALQVTEDGDVVAANRHAARMTGRHIDALRNKPLDLILPWLNPENTARWLLELAQHDIPLETEILQFNGTRMPVFLQVRKPDILAADHYLLSLQERPQQEQMPEDLLLSEQRLRQAVEIFDLCHFDWELDNGRATYDGEWPRLTGLTPETHDPLDIHWLLDLLHAEDHGMVFMELTALRQGRKRRFDCEVRLEADKGEEDRWYRMRAQAIRGENGKPERVIGALQDISTYKSTEQQAALIVQQDALTGLPNRQHLLNQIHRVMDTGDAGAKTPFALIMIDVDRFRYVNESLGHELGDSILRILATRIQKHLRQEDLVARLSGDQFAVLAQGVSPGRAVQARIIRIRRKIAETLHVTDEIPVNLDINVGIRYWNGKERLSAEEILRDASVALHHAKETGTTRVVEYFPELQRRMMETVRFENDIREAIRNDGVEVHYQPIIEAHTGRPIGFEALVRMRHPERGLIPPADFIGIAEETGLIGDLSRIVLKKATRQLAAWKREFPSLNGLTVAINLSPSQFDDPAIIDQIAKALEKSGLSGDDIKIEVTESMLMENTSQTVTIMEDMKDRGIRICIDDFGTGYSSFSHLRNHAFDTLKIDRSFIMRITEDKRDAELVRTILQLGQNIGMNIIVEGVETKDQRTLLSDLGAHHMQGFLFGKPLPAKAISDWLSDWVPG